jgi:chemotaxis protein CheZ
MASAAARTPRASKPARAIEAVHDAPKPAGNDTDIQSIVKELAAVADYIGHMKQEIAALKPNELSRERIPTANDELGNVVQATASATHTIMAAAEEILGAGGLSDKDYRELVETRVLAIFEACSFQDITGQRISKVVEALGQLEKRLSRFAGAVNARDSDNAPVDPEDALRQARKEILLLNGPQLDGAGIAQDDIDALFN